MPPSRFLAAFDGIAQCHDYDGIRGWIARADWTSLTAASGSRTA